MSALSAVILLWIAPVAVMALADRLRGRPPRPRAGVAVKARHASPTACYSAREDAP